jgi:hypothetical protein
VCGGGFQQPREDRVRCARPRPQLQLVQRAHKEGVVAALADADFAGVRATPLPSRAARRGAGCQSPIQPGGPLKKVNAVLECGAER